MLRSESGRDRYELFSQELKRGYVLGGRHGAEYEVDSEVCELFQLGQERADIPAARTRIKRISDCLLDVGISTSHVLAVGAQDVEFAFEVRAREEVAAIGVLSDEPQGLFLARAADEDRRVRAPTLRRLLQRAADPVTLPAVWTPR